MYSFKENIPQDDFIRFVSQADVAPIQQTVSWSKLKNNWQSFFCGIYKDKNLIGVSLILVRKILPLFSYAYCPRGPILDFSDKEAVAAFKNGIFDFCKKRKIYSVMIDPPIVVGKTLPELSSDAYFDPFDPEKGKSAFENLISEGFIHGGFGKDLHSALQPRYNAMIPLKKSDKTPLSFDELKKNFKTKIRKYYANFQAIRGLYYEKAEPTKENISTFKKIIENTEARQKISLREEEYFSLLAKSFEDKAFFGFEKCNIETYISNLEKRLQKEPENTEKIKKQISDAKEVIAERGNKIPLAALLTVYPPNEKGTKVAEYLYAGSDLTVFSSFCATLCGLGAQCVNCIEKDIDFLNLGGLAGTFDDGLYDFKKQFNPIIVEYAGEFTLPIKKFRYRFMKKGLPFMKKTYKNFKKIIKRK